jgi:hypothetical protein
MRTQLLRLLLVVLALVVTATACGDDDGGGGESAGSAAETASADLAQGVAALVDGDEISVASIDDEVDAVADNPQISDQLEGSEGESTRVQLRAQVLSTAIVTRIVEASAEDLGRPVTDDDVARARSELEEQLGGAEALDEALSQRGYTDSLLEMELVGLAGLQNVAAALDEEAGGEASGEDGAEPGSDGSSEDGADDGLTPSQRRAQEYLSEQLASAEVTVDGDFGTWDARSGLVVPPGSETSGDGSGGD